ncbi:MAG: enoyl-CoA hydratase/isomerase family protein [Acidimicrobiia bacterium]
MPEVAPAGAGPRIVVAARGAVTTIALGHPPANALSLDFLDEITAAAHQARALARTRVVVVSSTLPRIFMAGADLEARDAGDNPAGPFVAALHRAFGAIEALAVPTIAAVGGHALGGGCELALACDFRVMARGEARIGLPEVRLGLLAAGGGTQRLVRLVGRATATDLLLRGRALGADEARAVGLVHETCDPGELDATVAELAEELSRLPPLALAAAKRLIREGPEVPFGEAVALEAAAMAELEPTEDAREGVRAFLERRPGVFRGR